MVVVVVDQRFCQCIKMDVEVQFHAYCFFVVVGRIFPSQGDLHIVPFNDEALYMEQFSKAHFWSEFVTFSFLV